VRLGDPHLEETLGELLAELLRPRALRQVRLEHDQFGVRLAQAGQRVAERVARRDRRRSGFVLDRRAHQLVPPVASWAALAARSSRTASSSCACVGATPCQPTLPSMNDTPFPFVVSARMNVGLPFVARASAKAAWIDA